jgi:hypothetical protein
MTTSLLHALKATGKCSTTDINAGTSKQSFNWMQFNLNNLRGIAAHARASQHHHPGWYLHP